MISDTTANNITNTGDQNLEQMDAKIEENIRFYAAQPPEAISKRIEALDRECDLDQTMALAASGLGLGTLAFSFIGGRKWLLVTGAALGLLLKHMLHGTSPAVPLLRKRGVRTRSEIDREKYALKILRGDFEHMPKRDQLKANPAQEVLRTLRS